jgi:Rrf2 family protein
VISQTAEYALRAIVYLADQQGEPQTTAQIADAAQIPAGYLAKVMQSLSRARLVRAQRGLRGGFTLTTPPDRLTVLQVVNAVDPPRRFRECPLGLHGINLCPLHRLLDDAAQLVEDSFGKTTIADLLNVPRSRKPLCRFPISPQTAS